jgi:hypothetical protein
VLCIVSAAAAHLVDVLALQLRQQLLHALSIGLDADWRGRRGAR